MVLGISMVHSTWYSQIPSVLTPCIHYIPCKCTPLSCGHKVAQRTLANSAANFMFKIGNFSTSAADVDPVISKICPQFFIGIFQWWFTWFWIMRCLFLVQIPFWAFYSTWSMLHRPDGYAYWVETSPVFAPLVSAWKARLSPLNCKNQYPVPHLARKLQSRQ